MLIRKGTRVILDLSGGRDVVCPKSWGMMHDPSGRDWPKDKVLIIPYRVTGEPIEDSAARHYFGHGYDVERGEPTGPLPPKDMRQWTRMGSVKKIWYTRPGTSHPGPFKHDVGGGWLSWLLGKRRAILYHRRGAYCLDFPDGVIADARGFVHP